MATGRRAVVGGRELWQGRETNPCVESRQVGMRLSEGGRRAGIGALAAGANALAVSAQELAGRPPGLASVLRMATISFHLQLIQGTEVRLRVRKLGSKRQIRSGTCWHLDGSLRLHHAPRCAPSPMPHLDPVGRQHGPACKELCVVGGEGTQIRTG